MYCCYRLSKNKEVWANLIYLPDRKTLCAFILRLWLSATLLCFVFFGLLFFLPLLCPGFGKRFHSVWTNSLHCTETELPSFFPPSPLPCFFVPKKIRHSGLKGWGMNWQHEHPTGLAIFLQLTNESFFQKCIFHCQPSHLMTEGHVKPECSSTCM